MPNEADPSTWNNASYEHHPVEDLEPDDLIPENEDSVYRTGYTDAAKRFLFILNTSMGYIARAKDKDVAVAHVSYALGLMLVAGKSMGERGNELGVGRAAISKGANIVCRECRVKPSGYMKDEDSRETFSKSRVERVEKGMNKL